ncbi:hypothetical protein LCGC14_2942670, partial [marine sediment metagenome]
MGELNNPHDIEEAKLTFMAKLLDFMKRITLALEQIA